mmetsp:Transcript_9519/g.31469  ORF Transcript_9519/g.31469 Transcript_9519/m.31469 type:complete len:215 (+) Transcript_9519:307-951(+)
MGRSAKSSSTNGAAAEPSAAGTTQYDPGERTQATDAARASRKAAVAPTTLAARKRAARRPVFVFNTERPTCCAAPHRAASCHRASTCVSTAQKRVASGTSKTYCGFVVHVSAAGPPPAPDVWSPGTHRPRYVWRAPSSSKHRVSTTVSKTASKSRHSIQKNAGAVAAAGAGDTPHSCAMGSNAAQSGDCGDQAPFQPPRRQALATLTRRTSWAS